MRGKGGEVKEGGGRSRGWMIKRGREDHKQRCSATFDNLLVGGRACSTRDLPHGKAEPQRAVGQGWGGRSMLEEAKLKKGAMGSAKLGQVWRFFPALVVVTVHTPAAEDERENGFQRDRLVGDENRRARAVGH